LLLLLLLLLLLESSSFCPADTPAAAAIADVAAGTVHAWLWLLQVRQLLELWLLLLRLPEMWLPNALYNAVPNALSNAWSDAVYNALSNALPKVVLAVRRGPTSPPPHVRAPLLLKRLLLLLLELLLLELQAVLAVLPLQKLIVLQPVLGRRLLRRGA